MNYKYEDMHWLISEQPTNIAVDKMSNKNTDAVIDNKKKRNQYGVCPDISA